MSGQLRAQPSKYSRSILLSQIQSNRILILFLNPLIFKFLPLLLTMILHSFIRVALLFAFAAEQRAMATNTYLDAVIPSHVSLDLDKSHDDPSIAQGKSGHSAPSLFADYPSSGFEEVVKGNKVRELRQTVATCLASKATGISHHPDQLGRGMCVVDSDAQGPRAEFIRYVVFAFNMYVASRKVG